MEGFPTVGEFMERRLTPAVNTCAAIASRQEALARRIAQTNDLLRTRVGIVQEQQNRQILQSLNRRAAQQLKLQQAVGSAPSVIGTSSSNFRFFSRWLLATSRPARPTRFLYSATE